MLRQFTGKSAPNDFPACIAVCLRLPPLMTLNPHTAVSLLHGWLTVTTARSEILHRN